jgi:hypothetical protein
MKVKDLPEGSSMHMRKVKTPKGVVGYWKSQWGYSGGQAGIWLSDGKTNRIYPQFVDKLSQCAEWEITDEEVNCHKLTAMKYTDMII